MMPGSHCSAHSARSPIAPLVVAMATALVTISMCIPAAGARPWSQARSNGAASPSSASPAPGADPAVTTATVELREQSPAFIAPTDTLKLKLAVRDAPAGSQLGFSVRQNITEGGDREQLSDIIDGRLQNNRVVWPGITVPVANLEAGEDGTVIAHLTIAESQTNPLVMFGIEDPGVYPLTVTLKDEEGRELDGFTTLMVKLPPSRTTGPPLDVSTIVGFHAPVALQPDGSTDMSPDDQARLRRTIDVLASHPDAPFTFDPTPETVGALAALAGSDDPDGAPTVDQVARATGDHEIRSSTYVDVDLDAWIAADLRAELDNQLTLGADTLRTHLHPSSPVEQRAWIAARGPSIEALSQLHSFGVDQLVVPEASVAPLDTATFDPKTRQVAQLQTFEIELGDGDRLRAITTDATLAGRLVASPNPALAAQYAVADLALLYFGALAPSSRTAETKRRGVVLAVPDDPKALAAFDLLLDALDQQPAPTAGARTIVRPVTLAEIFAIDLASTPKTSEALVRPYQPPPAASPSLREFATQLERAHRGIDGYRSMVAVAAPEAVASLDKMMRVAGAAGLTANDRQAYFSAAQEQIDRVSHSIMTPGQEQVTLTAAEAQIPIQLQNDLPYPVEVRVVLANPKLEFPEKDGSVRVGVSRQLVTLQPGSNRITVAVRARTSGGFPLDVRVESPDGNLVLSTTQFQVRSTVFSGLGLALSIGAGFFLLLWWTRHFRSVRRAQKLVSRDGHGEADDTDDTFAADEDTDGDTDVDEVS